MERDALAIRNLAMRSVKESQQLSCGYDMQEQIQRAGTELHLLFSELYGSVTLYEADTLTKAALKKAKELEVLLELNDAGSIGANMIGRLILTLRTYGPGRGKFRKFARKNTGGSN